MSEGNRVNWGLKILSLLLAVVLWIYVSNELNPTKQREFKAVSVETRGVAPNLAVTRLPEHVRVTVQGNQNSVTGITSNSIEVFVDLSGLGPGRVQVPVRVNVPEGIKVVDLRPKTVTVNLETLAEKLVQVKSNVKESVAPGYKVLDIETKPDKILINGPKSLLDKTDFAYVDINIKDKDRSFGETVPVIIRDDSGNILDERLIKRSPTVVDIMVFIVPDMPSKKVRVVPRIYGEPARGYVVKMTDVQPEEIIITGESDLLNTINEVYTSVVDVTGAKKKVVVTTVPELPPGVNANRPSLTVVVEVQKE